MATLGRQLMGFISRNDLVKTSVIAGRELPAWREDAEAKINEWLTENTDKITLLDDEPEGEGTLNCAKCGSTYSESTMRYYAGKRLCADCFYDIPGNDSI